MSIFYRHWLFQSGLTLLLTLQAGIVPAQQVMPRLLRAVSEPPDVNLKTSGIAEDAQGRLWLATQDGTVRFDGQQFEVFHDPVLRKGDDYFHVVPSVDGRIWFKMGRGYALPYFDEQLKRIVRVPDSSRLIRQYLAKPGCHYVFADAGGILWIGTRQNGLLRFNPRTGAVDPVFTEKTGVNWITQDRQGVIWFTTLQGVYAYHPATRRLLRFAPDPKRPETSLASAEVFGIRARPDGTILVGLSNEVNLLTPATGQVRRLQLTPATGPPSSGQRVYDFHDDALGNTYFQSETAVFRLSRQGELQRVEFSGLTEAVTDLYVSRANRLWVSAGRSLLEYDLGRVRTVQPLNLIDVTVDGTHLEGHVDSYPESELPDYRLQRDSLGQPTITLREAALLNVRFSPYVGWRSSAFRFRLEGYDRQWLVEEGVDATVAYQLPAGTYRFVVNRALPTGGWEPTVSSLRVVVKSPFYKTNWFLGLTAVLVATALGLLYRTARRRQKLRQQLARKELEAASLRQVDELKSQFFANITHEFRTPLTLILNSTEHLEKTPDDPRRPERFAAIRRNADHLLRLITQLLDTAKLDASKLLVKQSLGNPDAFVEQLVQSFAAMAEKKGVRLSFRGGANQAFFFDEEKLEKIGFNLLSNALKFTPEGGSVDVRLTIDDSRFEEKVIVNRQSYLVIQVSDTGPGIPPEQLPRIFERFYQADASSTRAYEGTGIGLAFVKELSELLGGSVQVESKVGKGSTFTVSIPVEVPAHSTVAHEGSAPLLIHFHSTGPPVPTEPGTPPSWATVERAGIASVLVVEDNDELRQYLVETLSASYRVHAAVDGRAGLDAALELVPDLVLSDVMMPRMDGYALTEALKADVRTSHVPVVLLTAKSSYDSKLRGLGLGADAYLGKPFSLDELDLSIRNILQTRRAWQAVLAGSVAEKAEAVLDNPIPEKERLFLERLKQLLLRHLQDEAVDVDWLADQANMSRAQLHRKLTALTSHSTTWFVNHVRLEKAAELLRAGNLNVAEVAYRVGYGSQSYFTKMFQQHFGHLPTKFKS